MVFAVFGSTDEVLMVGNPGCLLFHPCPLECDIL